ncbi:hypothetical protein SFUMM280S_03379 [Streptomyces fumanus]
MAGVVGQDRAPGRPVVAAEGEEDLIVAADQPVPQAAAVVGEPGVAPVVGEGQVVRGEHGGQRAVLVEHPPRPGQALVGDPPVQGEDQPLAARGAHHVATVVAVRGGAAEGRHRGVAPGPERGQVGGVAALVVGGRGDVVVARQHAVRHLAVQMPEGVRGPLDLVLGAVLGDVAEMGQERDVGVGPLGHQVAERLLQRRGVGAVGVEQVLRVGQHGEGEPRTPGVEPAARRPRRPRGADLDRSGRRGHGAGGHRRPQQRASARGVLPCRTHLPSSAGEATRRQR